jgi:NADH-quinone oxidoreductase subunit N
MTWEIDALALGPEIIVSITLLAVLAVDLFTTRSNKYWTATIAVVGTTLAFVPLIFLAVGDLPRSMFDGSFVVDDFALVFKGLFLVAAYLVLLMSVSYIESDRYYQGEYYLLLLSSLLGSLVLASARDLIVLFIAIELATIPQFMLAGWRKGDIKSNEGSLKYFVLGVLSTALMLYGMSIVFGLTGAVLFDQIRAAIPGLLDEPALVVGILLMIFGFAFKVTAVPFHFWAPDTYEGAPTPVTAYLSVSSKVSGFVAMLAVVYLALPDAAAIWGPALWVMAALSMTVANLSALRQSNIVRLLAYSSVAQGGFMLVPFAAAAVPGGDLEAGLSATVVYLVIYAFMNLGAFGVVVAGAKKTGTGEIDGWAGLGGYDPRLGVLLAVFFLSLAGIPPLAGWFAKFVMFGSAIGAGGTAALTLAVIAALNAVVAFYYYARVVKVAWFDPIPDVEVGDRSAAPASSLVLVLGITAALVVIIGFFPGVSAFFGEATRSLLAAG